MTTPLNQIARGETWRFCLPVSTADRQMKLPVLDRKGTTFDVMPRPRGLTLLVDDPDHPARLSAAIKALTERVALRREDLPLR
ncbi:hypothetical protein [Rhodobacter sp. 24-YEA-8]|uniref:hypothetical protein n=1 Tax=Rhodobacter sp. 24-YEA-8 TaxID=1884310 RepID=UPI0008954873|nr:hypothetical protein [Rhodobacter sp. 24-YEA-8]SEC75831.1 hypothetical protein SAMN05519105_3225 [Rhodobacter sp. 24-YEA-8]